MQMVSFTKKQRKRNQVTLRPIVIMGGNFSILQTENILDPKEEKNSVK